MMSDYSFAPKAQLVRDNSDIPNGAFWPALNQADFCEQYAIDDDLPNAMIKNALVIAAARTNRRLNSFRHQVESSGAVSLENADSSTVAELSVVVALYLQAVYSDAKAQLITDSITTGRRVDAENSARTGDELATHYFAQATGAIAEIQGVSATGVYLI
ncbi:MAG: hypothetical protein COB09_11075 [Thalassobium sp.]|jgi:hypothetical protein|nr:MAG: hypothetical protein COB09_11075 [Thalassobium sp.]